ncbi:siderophore ABC transporter substrate-binding protein [Bacillus sp. BGMRC 2118]|nr:siderophore ABC transporter substrate-binding protein [Bacillus sp. BGMRC 2118]
MKNKKLAFGLFALVLMFMLAACGSGEKASTEETKETSATADQSKKEEAGGVEYPMTVKPTIASVDSEDKGTIMFEDVTFDKMPEKMVVFDYGFLDTLDALGVEGVAGVAKDSTLPSHLKKYEADEYANIGTLKAPLLEDIAEIDPDVIFISGRQSPFYEDLKEIAPVVFVGTTQEDYWNTFLASVDTAAKMFGKEAKADEYIAKFDQAFEDIKAVAGNYKSSLVTMYNEGNLSGFGPESRFGYVYNLYGFKMVSGEIVDSTDHGSNFGFEAILEYNPEVLFVIDRTAAIGGKSNIASDMENDIVKKTDAYKNKRIIYLDGALWYLGGGGIQSELAKIEEIIDELK